MKESHLSTLLNLRLIIGFLGEKAQYAWWPTEFYAPTSYSFLTPVFARTSQLARYQGVVEAAKRLHDEHLNVGSYHLFRLPEEIEQNLRSMMQRRIENHSSLPALLNKEAAIDELGHMASSEDSSDSGPILVGSISDINSSWVLQSIACHYLTAFSQGSRVYPYLGG